MSDSNNCARGRASAAEDHGASVVFHKLVSHDKQSHCHQDNDSDERTEERVHLRCFGDDEDDDAVRREKEEAQEKSRNSLESSEKEALVCPPAFCVTNKPATPGDEDKPKRCPGLGLFYAFLSSVFFSIIALLVKTIQDLHSIEISAIRCFFQMLFVIPLLIYNKTSHAFPLKSYLNLSLFSSNLGHVFLFSLSCIFSDISYQLIKSSTHPSMCSFRTGFLGPRDKRIYLVLRGFLGSNAMIMLFYAVQQMPLADATVIMFSNPVFTSLLAWIFLKEKCTILDCVFTVFTLTGVILIARPPFLFGEHLGGIEGNYSNHIKGTVAAFAGAIGAAFTIIILRKMGKSVHYYLSVWYYAVIGFIETVITVFILGEWKIPACGRDRWLLVLIAVLGIAGQSFLTKALQTEKAGPVSLMRTVDVVLAFFFQFIFFGRAPTWWSLGGSLCIVASTSGVALRKWYSNSRRK